MILLLIRGLPGSGKSTLAKQYVADGFVHVESDHYHTTASGDYLWLPKNVAKAHQLCQSHAEAALLRGNDVVVTNTFTQRWEIASYDAIAERTGAKLVVSEAKGQYQNIHGVPEEVLEKMRARWEEWPGD